MFAVTNNIETSTIVMYDVCAAAQSVSIPAPANGKIEKIVFVQNGAVTAGTNGITVSIDGTAIDNLTFDMDTTTEDKVTTVYSATTADTSVRDKSSMITIDSDGLGTGTNVNLGITIHIDVTE
jgi:hypothetical protein